MQAGTSKPGGLCDLLLGGGLAVVVGFGAAGYHGHHSDLATQRALVQVRQVPEAFAGDLLADHAMAHPSLLLDVLALVPHSAPTELLVYALMMVIVGVFSVLGARALGCGRWASLWAPVLIVLPRPLLAGNRLLHAAPLARTAAVALMVGALAAVLRGSWKGTGLLLGLCLAVHPSMGLQLAVVLIAAMATTPSLVRSVPPMLLLAGAVAAPVLLPWVWLGGALPATDAQGALMALRSGHHLRALDWSAGGWGIVAVHLTVVAALCPPARRREVGAMCGAALVLIGAAVVGDPVRWPELARLHLAYAAVVPAILAVLLAGRTQGWWWLAVLPLMVFAERALVPDVPGGPVQWQAPIVGAPLQTAASPPRCVSDDPWRRIRTGQPVYFSIKDGGEVVGSPAFAQQWGARLTELCGPDAAALPDDSRVPGWTRVAARCASAPRCPAVQPY